MQWTLDLGFDLQEILESLMPMVPFPWLENSECQLLQNYSEKKNGLKVHGVYKVLTEFQIRLKKSLAWLTYLITS